MGASSKAKPVRERRATRVQKKPKGITHNAHGGEKVFTREIAASGPISLPRKTFRDFNPQTLGARSELLSDADSGYAGENISQAAESPANTSPVSDSGFLDDNLTMGQISQVVGSPVAPSRPLTSSNALLSLDKDKQIDQRILDYSRQPTDMEILTSKPYLAGLNRRLSIKSLPGIADYWKDGFPGRLMNLEEVRAEASNKKRKLHHSEHRQGPWAGSHREDTAWSASVHHQNRRPIAPRQDNEHDFHQLQEGTDDAENMLHTGPDGDSASQATAPTPTLLSGVPHSIANGTFSSVLIEPANRFTDYDWSDSFAWINTHHDKITTALESGADPIKCFPMISKHALALWSVNLPSTHNADSRFGRILLSAPPSPQAGYSMRHAPRDPGPSHDELDACVDAFFTASTNEGKSALIEEVDFLLTALRWSMSLTSLTGTVMKRFTVFAANRQPDFVETAKWKLLRAWLGRQHLTTAQQVWEKPGVEEGWDVLVPAGMPGWAVGVEAPTVERVGRAWSPHPQDRLVDQWRDGEGLGRAGRLESDLERDRRE